jgi:signal transduction histidine kinase/DNA-binding response OmpR family regulator
VKIRRVIAVIFGGLLAGLVVRTVIIGRELQHVDARATGFLAASFLFAAVLIGGWLAIRKWVERPLVALADYANDASDRVPPRPSGAKEVADVTRAVISMRSRLDDRRIELETTLSALAEAVFVFDESRTCRLTNPAGEKLLGQNIVGKRLDELRSILRLSAPGGDEGPIDPEGGVHNAVRKIIDGTGASRILSINTVRLPPPYAGIVASARDITPEHELAEKLAEQNKALTEASLAKTQFLATMSHELRTPLNAVIGFSEMLLEGTYGPVAERQRAALSDVHSAGRHLLTLIDDLLDLSKVDAGHLAMAVASFEVMDVISEALSLVRRSAELKNLKLEVAVRSGTYIRADRARLRQVVLNLLSNAIKFTPERGTITVTARVADGRVRIDVADTGIGIREEDAHRLFQPFSQLDSGERRRYGGTGLGLSISKRLVELMGGTIGFTSTHERGSTFFVELPEGTPPSMVPLAATPTARPRTPPPVLVIEDEATDAAMIEASLSHAGYAVRIVRDAELALESLESFRPALMLVDLALPGMSGFTFIDRVRAVPRFAQLPIVVLTGRDLAGDERESLEARVQLVARKGTASFSDLLTQIAMLVPPGGPREGRARVLVIDDNDVNRRVAIAMCDVLGYDTIEAADAEEGIKLAKSDLPDAILMDIQMPGMDGIEATKILRRDRRTGHIPIIALTAHAMAGDADRFRAAGCSDYVAKPMGRASLGAALTRALGSSARAK